MAKAKPTPKINIKTLGIGVVIGVIALFGVLLYLGSHNSLGTINNPYNSSLGYQGAGYYLSHTHKFYAINLSEFNQNSYSTNSSSATQNTTGSIVSTTSIYYTTMPYTTTIPQTNYGCSPLPCTTFKNGNFTFIFSLLNGSVEQWHFPLISYNYWISTPRIAPILHLNDTITGKPIYTYDYRGLVTPSFFANVTPQLTNGKTAGQFVNEVQNINSQLVNYSLVFGNTSVYSAQVLAQGQGDCKDKGILIASILEAGNIQANYGMKIQFVYVDADNLTAPRTVNHLMLYITFANGTKEFLDTTHVLATSPYFNGTVDGWYYNLTCTMSSCQSTPICTGAYCDAVGYTVGSSSGFNYCNSGYVTTANNTCQYECGADYYCNVGSSCYNNQCVSCQAGTILGSDGLCHTQCGTGYCNTGSSCYNNQCVSCNSGYVLGSDGLCHQECGSSTTYCTGSNSYCYNNQCVSCPTGYYLGTDGQCYYG